MLIPPKYTITPQMVTFIQEIEQVKTKLDLSQESAITIQQRRRKSLLKSSIYSARIEGNPHTVSEINLIDLDDPKEISKIELANLYQTHEKILNKTWSNHISIDDLKDIHQSILKDISPDAGHIRVEQSAIFNRAGVAIYVTPPSQEIKKLLNKLLLFINSNQESTALIKAAVAHYSFEKIHPFLDGNGRVGRVLIHLILKKFNYDLNARSAFENYIDEHKETYYHYLSLSPKDITSFIEFILQSILEGFRFELSNTKAPNQTPAPEDLLPLRRKEILNIIRDHPLISFDFIKRRFMTVSDRLIRYDLKKLQDINLIKKRGATKGVIYEAI